MYNGYPKLNNINKKRKNNSVNPNICKTLTDFPHGICAIRWQRPKVESLC